MTEEQLLSVFTKEHHSLRSIAVRYVGTMSSDADDVLQETFLKAWLKLDTLQDDRNAAAWLRSITYHESIDTLRKRKNRRETSLFGCDVIHANTEMEARLLIHLQVERLLQSIPARLKDVVALFYLMGYQITEIAEILNCPSGTVKSMLFYARQAMKASA